MRIFCLSRKSEFCDAVQAACRLCRGRCRTQPFATKERYGCGSTACQCTSSRCSSYEFAVNFRKISLFCWVDVGIDPYKQAGKLSEKIDNTFFTVSRSALLGCGSFLRVWPGIRCGTEMWQEMRKLYSDVQKKMFGF